MPAAGDGCCCCHHGPATAPPPHPSPPPHPGLQTSYMLADSEARVVLLPGSSDQEAGGSAGSSGSDDNSSSGNSSSSSSSDNSGNSSDDSGSSGGGNDTSWGGCIVAEQALAVGILVVEGSANPQPSAQACCASCSDWGGGVAEGVDEEEVLLPCNAWNWCPLEGGCYYATLPGSISQLDYGECEWAASGMWRVCGGASD